MVRLHSCPAVHRDHGCSTLLQHSRKRHSPLNIVENPDFDRDWHLEGTLVTSLLCATHNSLNELPFFHQNCPVVVPYRLPLRTTCFLYYKRGIYGACETMRQGSSWGGFA